MRTEITARSLLRSSFWKKPHRYVVPAIFLVFGGLLTCGHIACSAEPVRKIVLIGGPKSHGFGEHDFQNGLSLLQTFLESLSNVPSSKNIVVAAYPNDWPTDPSALEGASTLVLYFDGVDRGYDTHPLLNPKNRAAFEKIMRQGVGLVAFHQAWTVPPDDHTIDLPRWLGAARYGMLDRTFEAVRFRPAAPAHPVSRGVGEFQLYDEFYPTLRFFNGGEGVTPILIGKVHIQIRNGEPVVFGSAVNRTQAWAFERANGGRAFGFAGLHYVESLDDPQLRKLLLNAILWTAKIEVPRDGVSTSTPVDAANKILNKQQQTAGASNGTSNITEVKEAILSRAADNSVITYPWGQITWYVSRELRNSDTLTVGQAIIKTGQENPRHFHPNCDEVLHVIQGHILHTMDDKTVEMSAGDTVSIPRGVKHNAKNIGTQDAVLSISFSSADRQVVGE